MIYMYLFVYKFYVVGWNIRHFCSLQRKKERERETERERLATGHYYLLSVFLPVNNEDDYYRY